MMRCSSSTVTVTILLGLSGVCLGDPLPTAATSPPVHFRTSVGGRVPFSLDQSPKSPDSVRFRRRRRNRQTTTPINRRPAIEAESPPMTAFFCAECPASASAPIIESVVEFAAPVARVPDEVAEGGKLV